MRPLSTQLSWLHIFQRSCHDSIDLKTLHTAYSKYTEMISSLSTIVLFSTVPFWFSLNGDFVFDDSEAVVKNKDVHGNSWSKAFSNDFWGMDIKSNMSHKSYRPLTILSFRLNYFFSSQELNATQFKITNVALHSMSCILLWFTLRILLDENNKAQTENKAMLTTLLFSVHPIHVESVSGVVGRADILAALLFALSFIFYCSAIQITSKMHHIIHFWIALALAGGSMLCKENGITIMGLCIFYELSIKFKSKNLSYRLRVMRVAGLMAATVSMLVARWVVMGKTTPKFKPMDNPAAFANDTFIKVTTHCYIYFLNILLLIWPQWLCYDWSMGCVPLINEVTDYRILFVALMFLYIVLILRCTVFSKDKAPTKRHIKIGVLLMAVPFLPAANIFFPVGFVIAERILYIPSAGFCLLIVIGLSNITYRKKWRKTGLFFYGLLLLTFALKSWHRSLDWRDEYNLFTSALSVCPMNAKVHYNVAKAADAAQKTDWALDEYRKAIRLYPEYYQAMNNLANLLKNQKQYAEAELYLRTAISHKEDFPAAWMNLGIVLASTKRYEESERAYQKALKYRTKYPDCYYNLGNLNLELNHTESAIENWSKAIAMSPKHNLAWTNLLALLDNTGQLSKATHLIPQALSQLQDSPSVNFAIANIYGKLERYNDAEKHFLRAVELFDRNVQPIHFSNLGVLYHRWKKYDSAKMMYENALKIDPRFKSALQNLKSLQKNIK